jgi:5-methylcytosine-specific restriction enzyme subunit McrC
MRGFYRLLIYTGKLSKDVGSAQMHAVPHIFEWIILSFSARLHELVRQNLRKNYINCRENTRFLRGKLLIGEQIKRNFIHKERFYCEYDIFTEDILLNRILKCTCFLLYNITRNTQAKNNLWWVLFLMDRVRLTNILPHHFERLRLTRLGEGYRDIIALCEIFLRHSTVDITRGQVPAFSYMFNMNDLFEEFCYRFLRRYGDSEEMGLAGCDIWHERPRYKLFRKPEKFEMRPDITISDNEKFKFIIDTKYKPLDNKKDHCGIDRNDFYQMYTYLKKYDCKEGILLYPRYLESDFNIKECEYYNAKYENNGKNEESTHLHIRQVDLSFLSKKTDEEGKSWKDKIIKSFEGVFKGIHTDCD